MLNPDLFNFSIATEDERSVLIEFAVASNEKFNARSVSLDFIREVLNIKPEQITAGYVVKLMHPECQDLLGFYALRTNDEELLSKRIELQLLYVHPDHTRQGYGEILFKRSIDHAKDLGMHTMHGYSMPESFHFYTKYGAFKTQSKRNLFNPEGPEVILLDLNLKESQV